MHSARDGARGGGRPSRRRLLVSVWAQALGRVLAARHDLLLCCRWATHFSIVAGLGLAVIVMGPAHGHAGQAKRELAPTPTQAAATSPRVRRASTRGGRAYLVRAAVPRTVATQPTSTPAGAAAPAAGARGIETYVVQPGDTVLGLSRRFSISPETILSANPTLAGNPDLLRLGQELLILPVSGVLHEVEPGDTLNSIAERYKVGTEAIAGYQGNNLTAPYTLQPGQKLVVVGGQWDHAGPAVASAGTGADGNALGSGRFIWPTTGRITQGVWGWHMALDLGTPTGTEIYASDAGSVAESGWSGVGYGQYVVIDHGNGFHTLYAHMSQRLVAAGETVTQGQKIGLVGSTGNSTGPHLHFEIRNGDALLNPLTYLP